MSRAARRSSLTRATEGRTTEGRTSSAQKSATVKPIEDAKAAALPPPPPLLEPRHPPPPELLNAGGAVPVNVTTHVISLSDVDSREQRFEAHIWIQLEWTIRLKPDNPLVRSWRPDLTFLNLGRQVGESEPSFRAVPEGETGTRCFLAYTVHGVFLQRFELRAFPFDTQTLLVQAVLWRSPLERVMKPGSATREAECQPFRGRVTFSTGGHHCLYSDGFIQEDVWTVNPETCVTVRAGHTDERHRGTQDGQRFSTLTIEVCIKRRFEFYALNVLLPFVLFVCLSFISFAVEIPEGNLSDRTTITLSMVLTAAAFKIVIANFTPAVGYLTLLDQYVLLCFAFMSAVAACNVVVSQAPDEHTMRVWNHHLGIGLAFAWCGCHLLLPLAKWRSRRAHLMTVKKNNAREAADMRRWVAGALNRRLSLRQFAASMGESVSGGKTGSMRGLTESMAGVARRSLDRIDLEP